MSAGTEARLRRFLLAMSAALFAGTPVELWFAEHIESAIQLIPFALCAIGVVAAIAALMAPSRRVLLGLRVCMILVIIGGLFGWYEHLAHNIEFEMEIRPNATRSEVFWTSLSGASPLLAPGILPVAALLALGATLQHPRLRSSEA